MERNKLKLFLALGFILVSVNVSGHGLHNSQTNGETIRVTADTIAISDAVARKYELETKIEVLRDLITVKRSSYDQKEKELVKSVNTKRRYDDAVKRKNEELQNSGLEEISDSVQTLDRIQKELINQRDILEDSLKIANGKIGSLKQRLDVIEKLKERNAQIILAKYDDRLKLKFSEIEYVELDRIIRECKEYDENSTIQALISRAEQIKSFKQTYDNGLALLDTKYDAVKVLEMIETLTHLLDKMSDAQQSEYNALIAKLDIYDEGVALMCDYINFINNKRNGRSYSSLSFDDDSSYYFSKNRYSIEQYILVIPYLKRAYEVFNNALKQNGSTHHAIESEILSYQTATDNK